MLNCKFKSFRFKNLFIILFTFELLKISIDRKNDFDLKKKKKERIIKIIKKLNSQIY